MPTAERLVLLNIKLLKLVIQSHRSHLSHLNTRDKLFNILAAQPASISGFSSSWSESCNALSNQTNSTERLARTKQRGDIDPQIWSQSLPHLATQMSTSRSSGK